jgi:hypothetical protein
MPVLSNIGKPKTNCSEAFRRGLVERVDGGIKKLVNDKIDKSKESLFWEMRWEIRMT